CRTEQQAQGWIAHPMKKLARSAELTLGVVKQEGERFWRSPVDKRERRELFISELKDAGPGDLVLCEVTGRPPRVSARVDAVLGDPFAPRSFSLIAIHKHGLRAEFAQEAIDEAHRVAALPLDPPRDGEGDRAAKLSGGGGGVQGSTPPPSDLRPATSPFRGGACCAPPPSRPTRSPSRRWRATPRRWRGPTEQARTPHNACRRRPWP